MNPLIQNSVGSPSALNVRPSINPGRWAIRSWAFALLSGMMPAALAGSGEFELTWSATSSGSQIMSGGAFSVSGTVGQHDAGTTMTDATGVFGVTGGFWVIESTCTCELYGDVVVTCAVDVDDLLYVLDSFVDSSSFPGGDIEPCGGDADVDVDDILAELAAFVGLFACPHPCSPS